MLGDVYMISHHYRKQSTDVFGTVDLLKIYLPALISVCTWRRGISFSEHCRSLFKAIPKHLQNTFQGLLQPFLCHFEVLWKCS